MRVRLSSRRHLGRQLVIIMEQNKLIELHWYSLFVIAKVKTLMNTFFTLLMRVSKWQGYAQEVWIIWVNYIYTKVLFHLKWIVLIISIIFRFNVGAGKWGVYVHWFSNRRIMQPLLQFYPGGIILMVSSKWIMLSQFLQVRLEHWAHHINKIYSGWLHD